MAKTSQPQRAGYPLTWLVPPDVMTDAGKNAWVKITQIRTLAVERIGHRIGRLDDSDLTELIDALLQTIR